MTTMRRFWNAVKLSMKGGEKRKIMNCSDGVIRIATGMTSFHDMACMETGESEVGLPTKVRMVDRHGLNRGMLRPMI